MGNEACTINDISGICDMKDEIILNSYLSIFFIE